jgi:hypothetical protein
LFLYHGAGFAVKETKEKNMVEEPKITPLRSEIPEGEIPVFITKSNFYRVVHADGIYGGGTPTPGNIMMTFYSHRVPFPKGAVNDARGNEIVSKRDAKFGIEQEYEVSLVVSLETARVMLTWLNNTIKNTEILLQQRNQQK